MNWTKKKKEEGEEEDIENRKEKEEEKAATRWWNEAMFWNKAFAFISSGGIRNFQLQNVPFTHRRTF